MSQLDDREIEARLTEHLSKLDGQLGRASIRFSEERRKPLWWRSGGWIAAAISSAVAAGLAIALLAQPGHKPLPDRVAVTQSVGPAVPAPPAAIDPEPLGQVVAWRTQNDGLVMVDDIPMRRLRQRVVQQMRWYDREHNRLVDLTVPSEQVVLVPVRTY